MLEIKDLACQRGGRKLFDNVSFSLKSGEALHITGVNGSGKTSLLRMIAGLARPESGTIEWKGLRLDHSLEHYASELLYLGHQPAIKDDLTVLENLWVSLQMSGSHKAKQELKAALESVGLGKHSSLPARVLSQGQRRRLALARLWVERKPLWVLDEPMTALDVQAEGMLQQLLEEHIGEGGMLLFTSHQAVSIGQYIMCTMRIGA
jgi:heme exporter protein A